MNSELILVTQDNIRVAALTEELAIKILEAQKQLLTLMGITGE